MSINFWCFIIVYDVWRVSRFLNNDNKIIFSSKSYYSRKYKRINGSHKRLLIYCTFGFLIPFIIAVPVDPYPVYESLELSLHSLRIASINCLYLFSAFFHILSALNIFQNSAHFQAIDLEFHKDFKNRLDINIYSRSSFLMVYNFNRISLLSKVLVVKVISSIYVNFCSDEDIFPRDFIPFLLLCESVSLVIFFVARKKYRKTASIKQPNR